MIVFGAVMSGRQNVSQATATADEAVKAYESRRKEWDEEERRDEEAYRTQREGLGVNAH